MPRATPSNTKPLVPYEASAKLEQLTTWEEIKRELEEAENPPKIKPQRFYPPPR